MSVHLALTLFGALLPISLAPIPGEAHRIGMSQAGFGWTSDLCSDGKTARVVNVALEPSRARRLIVGHLDSNGELLGQSTVASGPVFPGTVSIRCHGDGSAIVAWVSGGRGAARAHVTDLKSTVILEQSGQPTDISGNVSRLEVFRQQANGLVSLDYRDGDVVARRFVTGDDVARLETEDVLFSVEHRDAFAIVEREDGGLTIRSVVASGWFEEWDLPADQGIARRTLRHKVGRPVHELATADVAGQRVIVWSGPFGLEIAIAKGHGKAGEWTVIPLETERQAIEPKVACTDDICLVSWKRGGRGWDLWAAFLDPRTGWVSCPAEMAGDTVERLSEIAAVTGGFVMLWGSRIEAHDVLISSPVTPASRDLIQMAHSCREPRSTHTP